MCSADIFLGVIAVLFPPLPVWVKRGICSADSLINILLCCLGFVPGLLHAWYIIAKFPEGPYDYDELPQDRESGRVTYVYVNAPPSRQPQPKAQNNSSGGVNYGTQGGGSSSQATQGQDQGATGSGDGNGGGIPPTYAEAVSGDHKVQRG